MCLICIFGKPSYYYKQDYKSFSKQYTLSFGKNNNLNRIELIISAFSS